MQKACMSICQVTLQVKREDGVTEAGSEEVMRAGKRHIDCLMNERMGGEAIVTCMVMKTVCSPGGRYSVPPGNKFLVS